MSPKVHTGDIEDEAVGAGKIVRGDFACGGIPSKTHYCPRIVNGRKKVGRGLLAYPLISPDLGSNKAANA